MCCRYFFEPASPYLNFFNLVTKERASAITISSAITTVLSHSKKSTMFLGVDEVLRLGDSASTLLTYLGRLSENFLPLRQFPQPQQSLFIVSTNLNENFLDTLSTTSGREIRTITTEPLPVMETLYQAEQSLKNLSTPELKTAIEHTIQSREFKLAIIQCGGFPRGVEQTLKYLHEENFNPAITFNQISAHLINVLWRKKHDNCFEYIVPVIKAQPVSPDIEIFAGKKFSDLVETGNWSYAKEIGIPQMPLIRIAAWARQFEQKASEIKKCCTIVSDQFPTLPYNQFISEELITIPIAKLAGCYLWEMLNPGVWWESGRGLESFSVYYELLMLLLHDEQQEAPNIRNYFPHTLGTAHFSVFLPQRLKLAIIKSKHCRSFCQENKWKLPHNTMFWFADNNPGFVCCFYLLWKSLTRFFKV